MTKGFDNEVFCSVVIVSYNPDCRLLQNVIFLSSINLIRDIIIVDNSTEENNIVKELSLLDKVLVIDVKGNKGIGYAQNIGIKESKKMGYKWVLTLDHDTIVKENLFIKYLEYISNHNCSQMAIIATDYYDIGVGKLKFNNIEPIDVLETISSGSLLNVNIYNVLGQMKEHYFIDQVDNEYCYRAVNNGYRIVILPGIGMEHRLGNTKEIKLCGKSFYLYNQAPIRTFYRTRNTLYFVREYNDRDLLIKKVRSLIIDFLKIFLEEDSMKKCYQFMRGLYYGIFGKI